MDTNKNSYTFGFSAIMVIIVAVLLSLTYILLKPFQDQNIELEKKQNILKSIGIMVDRESSESEYSNYIKEELVVNHLGEIEEGSAFDVKLKYELKKDILEQSLPLYIAEVAGEQKYIIPLRGKGLWGPIWGFIALNDDFNTISAAVFDHKAETPGLGAEINTAPFQDQFNGKTILEDDKFVSISVVKGGADDGDNHAVDGISGGTITSVGVEKMIKERLRRYLPYFKKISVAIEVEKVINFVDQDIDTNSNVIESKINYE